MGQFIIWTLLALFFLGLSWTSGYRAKDAWDEWRKQNNIYKSSSGASSAYSNMANAELKANAIKVVADIRHFLSNIRLEDDRQMTQRQSVLQSLKTDEERQRMSAILDNQDTELFARHMADYDKFFKVDAILLRNEILSRLAKFSRKQEVDILYSHPTNLIGIGMVVDDLEYLTKILS